MGSAAVPNICAIFGEGVVEDRTCRDCFKGFRQGDIPLKDHLRSGGPLQSDIQRIKVQIQGNPRLTTSELSIMLGYNQSTIDRHLRDVEKVNKLRTWVSNSLTSDNIQQRIIICNFLSSKRRRHRFLQQIVTSDEKWVLYVDHMHKYQWVNPENLLEPELKNDLHKKK